MERVSKILMLGAMSCLLGCLAPVALLILGGTGLGAAVADWRHCYRDRSFLATSGMVSFVLLTSGLLRWRVRNRARGIASQPAVLPDAVESESSDVPIACTLLASDLTLRLEEVAELSREVLAYAKRDDLTLHLHYFPEAEERVRQMVKKEQACCPFLSFYFEPHPVFVALRITAPETARATVLEIYAHFASSAILIPELARAEAMQAGKLVRNAGQGMQDIHDR